MAIPLESLSARFGSALGQGLETGLQQLAHHKMQQMQRSRNIKGLESLGFDPQQAQGLAGLNPELLQLIVGQKSKNLAPQKNPLQGLDALRTLAPGLSEQEALAVSQLPTGLQNEYFKNYLQNIPSEQPELGEQPTGIQALQQFAQQNQPQSQQQQQALQPEARTPSIEAKIPTKKSEAISPQEELKTPQKPQTLAQRVAQERERKEGIKELKESQKDINKVIDKEREHYHADREVVHIAQRMRENLQKNKEKIGSYYTLLTSNLPDAAFAILQRDPDIRQYKQDADRLVLKLSAAAKGRPSDLKIRLEQTAKPQLNQPVETQESALDDIIQLASRSSDIQRFIHDQKDSKTGYYPKDFKDRLSQANLALDNPLQHPDFYRDGTEYIDDSGVEYVLKNGQWEEKNG